MRAPSGRERDRPLDNRNTRDRSAILPIVGALLLLPPIADIFLVEARVGGVPFLLVYIFGVWAALIAGAAALARRLRDADATAEDAGGAAPPGADG